MEYIDKFNDYCYGLIDRMSNSTMALVLAFEYAVIWMMLLGVI